MNDGEAVEDRGETEGVEDRGTLKFGALYDRLDRGALKSGALYDRLDRGALKLGELNDRLDRGALKLGELDRGLNDGVERDELKDGDREPPDEDPPPPNDRPPVRSLEPPDERDMEKSRAQAEEGIATAINAVTSPRVRMTKWCENMTKHSSPCLSGA